MSAFSRLKKPKPSPRHEFEDRPDRKVQQSIRQVAACIQTPEDLDRILETVPAEARNSFEKQILKRLPRTFTQPSPNDHATLAQ